MVKFNNNFLNNLLNALPDQIAVIDSKGVIVYVNQSWINFGIENSVATEKSWLGDNYLLVCNEGLDDLGEPICNTALGIKAVLQGNQESYQTDYPCDSSVKRRWFSLHIAPLHGSQNKYYIVTHTDVTERREAEEMAQQLAMSDVLTGLANRRHLNDFLNIEWRRGIRSQKALSILMIDVDYFKQYNDAFGHICGDACLVTISKVIKQYTRRWSDLAARFGGEEFVLVLAETNLQEAQAIANKLCKKIADLELPHVDNSIVTISIGVSSVIPNGAIDEISLLNQADKALYEAKSNGRNRVETCDDLLRTEPSTRFPLLDVM